LIYLKFAGSINNSMLIQEILSERVINAFDTAKKQAYAAQVWDILQQSYSSIPGGFGSVASIEELIAKSGLWKMVSRGGAISAVNVYRDQYGRKSIASGQDGTRQGKRDYRMLKNDDVKLRRAWAEVSGGPEKMLARMGATAIPARYASMLTGKQILEFNDDGMHYTRLIAGEPHEKVMYGMVTVTPELVQLLTDAGIGLRELPDTFRGLDIK
jgi:hypothetical protein